MKIKTQIKGTEGSVLKQTIKKFKDVVKNPEVYLSIQDKKAEEIKQIVKSLYDYNNLIGKNVNKSKKISLKELILNGMDEEQIWQQLEIQNNEIVNDNLTQVSQLLSVSDEKYTIHQEMESESDDDEENLEGPMEFGNSEGEEEDHREEDDRELDQEINDSGSEKADNHDENPKHYKFRGEKTSIVDDQFFKLHEMKQFLDDEDRKEMRKSQGKYNDEDDDNYDDEGNEIDMFNDIESDEDTDDSPENLKYKAFFGEQDEDTKIGRRLKEKQQISKKRKKMRDEDLGDEDEYDSDLDKREGDVKFNMDDNEYYSDDQNKEVEQELDESDENEPKSSFEVREKRLKSRIKQMEKNALEEKSWQLRGEIDAEKRPLNSLLEEILDYDSAVRPAPVITEETTMKLEDIIKQRIKNKAFDDVVRKIRPVETPQEYRKKLILDQEKSKDSLVTVYEKEYLKQVTELTKNSDNVLEQKPKAHQEISNLMKTVFGKLDALSNFYYTPKPAAPEVKIITNTPAILMEDLQPTAVSNATLLAPEEVHRKSNGDLIGKGERTKTDKNRDLRKKKIKQKFINQKITEKNIKNQVNDDKLLNKLTKNRNIDKMDQTDSNKLVKSSKAFFTQLQESVTQKKSLGQNVKNKKDKNKKTPSMLKL